jgi:hypothetical protein
MAGLEDIDRPSPELGLWIKESAHRQAFGREVVAALAGWAHKNLGKESFAYPVAPAGASPKSFKAKSSGTAQIRNTSLSSREFPGKPVPRRDFSRNSTTVRFSFAFFTGNAL